MKKVLLTGIAALFLATGTAHTKTDVLGCFVRTYDKAHLAEHPDQLVLDHLETHERPTELLPLLGIGNGNLVRRHRMPEFAQL